MAADQTRDASLPTLSGPTGNQGTPAADPAELTDEQLDAVAGGIGSMQMSQPGSTRAMGDLQAGDPHDAPTVKTAAWGV
jgi:hypothetical protein